MIWSYDMDAGKTEPKVLLAYTEGVLTSRWLPAGKERTGGRWEFFPVVPKDPPYAWARWPEAPVKIIPIEGMATVVDDLILAGWSIEQILAEGLATP